MRRYWFKKLLLSYLPIFLAVMLAMIFIFIFATAEFAKKESAQANRVFAGQVLQSIDYSLHTIDQLMLNELGINETWGQFFAIQPGTNTYIAEYELSKKLNGIIATYPQIDSIYLMRLTDQKILSNHAMMDMNSLPDRDFLLQVKNQAIESRFWTDPREFPELTERRPVFSLVLPYPLLSGELGKVVVNVRTGAIREQLSGMSGNVMSFVHLYDGNGNFIAGTDSRSSDERKSEEGRGKGVVLSSLKSSYTGWEVQSGLKNGGFANIYASISYLWIILVLLAVLIGIGSIIYVTNRNYKPLERIIGRIDEYSSGNPLRENGKRDEFAFIASAFDDLIKQTNEDLVYKRRHFFHELFEGSRTVSQEEWDSEMKILGWNSEFVLLHAGLMDIDGFSKFCERYNNRDRSLLRFVFSNVIVEVAQSHGVTVWTEWISNQRMGLIFQSPVDNPNEFEVSLLQIGDKLVEWVRENLHLTVTIALGTTVRHASDIPHSYQNAKEALRYKAILGNSRVITQFDLSAQSAGDAFNQLQTIRTMAIAYRVGDAQWKEQLEQVVEEMQGGLFSRDDIVHFMNYVLYQLNRELMGLSNDIAVIWKEEAVPRLNRLIDNFEMLDDLSEDVIQLLSEYEEKIRNIREIRASHTLISDVRMFIEEHFANSDMSLTYIGEQFHIKTSYLSRLFKEETGENFVDYLARIRMEKAMKLLIETDIPVQEITARVGYTHYVSFYRVFKKITGTTPGHYRK